MVASATFQVLEALKSALEDITVANGYNTDVRLVEYYDRFHDDMMVYPAIGIAEIDATHDQTQFAEKNTVTMRVLLSCALETMSNEHEDVSQFVADIHRRLFSELPAFLGSMSRRVSVESVTRYHADDVDPRAGADVVIQILFRHNLTDPYTLVP